MARSFGLLSKGWSRDLVKQPRQFGKYYLLERINVGGMAEVFRAKAYGAEGFERLVAVKRILPSIAEDKQFIDMFIAEAKIAVQLNHANIAQLFELGVVDGAHYIALEHIHGRDLRAIFARCRNPTAPMPIAQATFIVMKICEGLDYAHNKRDAAGNPLHLIHRDVSPQNMLVSFEGEVKLIDFGIAKAAGTRSTTQAGILKGKFGYMSPEQVRGLPIDRRSDIFSCGIVLYELLTGERVFVGESDFSTLEKVRNVEVLPPSTYNRKIPEELERIVLKALAKDPDERYANAIDLHDELQAFVYTAGEICSRKELAAWMKTLFATEIAKETAKLEAYRKLRPQLSDNGEPIPSSPSTPVSQVTPAEQDSAKNVDLAQSGELVWDDEELDTQIYPGGESDAAVRWAALPQGSRSHGGLKGAPLQEAWRLRAAQRRRPVTAPRFARSGRRTLRTGMVVMGAVAILVVGAAVGMFVVPQIRASVSSQGQNIAKPAVVPSEPSQRNSQVEAPPVEEEPMLSLDKTGFDLFVAPNWILDRVVVKIDGRIYGQKPPLRARFLSPGEHRVEVLAQGFLTERRQFHLEVGEVKPMRLKLRGKDVIVSFRSTPRGVAVTLVSEGVRERLGRTPVSYKLNLGKQYDVVFEKKGFVTRTQPVIFSGEEEQTVAAVLEQNHIEREKVTSVSVPRQKSTFQENLPAGMGTIGIGSKPNGCDIYIDGKANGRTPRRSIQLKRGTHSVSLVCSEHNINDSFRVTVKSNTHKRILKNYMNRIEQ